MKKFFKIFAIFLAALFFLAWFISLFAPRAGKIEYGVTFSAPYAKSLGLDWKFAYSDIVSDLKPKYIRLSAYWDSLQPEQDKYDFADLDYQVDVAEQNNVKVVMAVGRRLPRWPECHDPSWIEKLSPSALETAQLSYIETVIRRYQNRDIISAWQVENEPYLSTFGICPPLNTDLLDREINLVKNLDPSRLVIITDSGELSFWIYSGGKGDVFGTTLYRYVYSDVFKRYWTNYIPSLYYRFKGGLLRLLHFNKPIAIMELEAEPWTTKGITGTPIEEQFKTMSMENFNTILGVAKNTGFSPQYLWGVEWWYWMKQQNHPEFWDRAKQLFNQ